MPVLTDSFEKCDGTHVPYLALFLVLSLAPAAPVQIFLVNPVIGPDILVTLFYLFCDRKDIF